MSEDTNSRGVLQIVEMGVDLTEASQIGEFDISLQENMFISDYDVKEKEFNQGIGSSKVQIVLQFLFVFSLKKKNFNCM